MRQVIQFMVVRLYLGMSSLYPYRFRVSFGDEIQEIFLRVVSDAEQTGWFGLLTTTIRELGSLLNSIIREHWHELRSGKEKKMATENNQQNAPAFRNGGGSLVVTRIPGWSWILGWAFLTTAALPAGLFLMAPFTALLLTVFGLGAKVGISSGIKSEALEPVGFCIGLALTYATSQGLMLRRYLPRTKTWSLGTGIGFLVAGILVGIVSALLNKFYVPTTRGVIVFLLLIGGSVGLAQWIAMRNTLRNAFWLLAIDVLAAASLLLALAGGPSITSLIELLIILPLPGLVTGVGIWILLKQSLPAMEDKERAVIPATTRTPKISRILLGLGSLIPLYFLFIWVYAISQIALAKNGGIYATPEEAVIAYNSQGWGGAEVVKVENVHAGVNRHDGSQPHVWFGGGTVYLDRVPAGLDRTEYQSGSYYIHVREGWVLMPEGAFPEFVGWVMELYDLEGVKEWGMENK